MAIINENELNEKLEKLDGWSYKDKSITKEYELADFTAALGFVTKAGVHAEKADHHPDILLHSWNKVKITLSTHDEGGVTEKDLDLAGKFESL